MGDALNLVAQYPQLTAHGAERLIARAVARAEEIGVPQCIAVVDAGGNLLAFKRMDSARFLSEKSSIAKARTAVSSRVPTGGIPEHAEIKLALATGGQVVNLKGGVPVVVAGHVVGGVGVGSGTGEQDFDVANTSLEAIAEATRW